MIKINDKEIKVEYFPDGTQRLHFDLKEVTGITEIKWFYENDSELVTLMFLINHIKNNMCDKYFSYNLYLPYIPNARMDRTHNTNEIFTLKYFCNIINSLGFDNVYVLDPHSNVSSALLNHCVQVSAEFYILSVINEIKKDNSELILYFPDEGAAKRYSEMFTSYKYKYVTGMKKRDWDTGKILGLDVIANGIDLKGKTILMVDDIISFGGSFYYSALKLKELGVNKIYSYATHTENSVLNREKGTFIKCLEDGTVEKLFTTNSIFTGKHDKIKVFEVM